MRSYRDQGMELVDYVTELTRLHQHAEVYDPVGRFAHPGASGRAAFSRRRHTTNVPALILQLVKASPSGDVTGRDDGGAGSRPAARIDALDTLMDIDRAASDWVRRLGHDDPADTIDRNTGVAAAGTGTIACIRLLGSLAPSQPTKIKNWITDDVRRWWIRARIVSGWDSPAWRPDSTCPMCGSRRTLRINLVAEVGFCTQPECGETWDRTNLGLLAEHIKVEAEDNQPPAVRPVTCMCRWPMEPAGRWGLCPACGSSVCVNAATVAEREDQRRRQAAQNRRIDRLLQIDANYATQQRQQVMRHRA